VRSPLTLPAVVLLSLGANACGGAHGSRIAARAASSRAESPARLAKDVDNPSERASDGDDGPSLRYFGHAASAGDRRAVTVLARRYYAAGAAGDGARACRLMGSVLAKSLVEEYRQPFAPSELHGKPCAAVMSAPSTWIHEQLVSEDATLKVTGVRIEGNQGYALLRSKPRPIGHMFVIREHGAWKVGAFPGEPG
jgi:hypothetical protein